MTLLSIYSIMFCQMDNILLTFLVDFSHTHKNRERQTERGRERERNRDRERQRQRPLLPLKEDMEVTHIPQSLPGKKE